MAKKKMSTKSSVVVKAPKIELVPVSRISTKSFENGRSGKWDEPTGDENAEEDFESFKANLRSQGQLTPCIVRPYANKSKKSDFDYELIVGYRRVSALDAIAKETGQDAMIKVEIRDLSDLEARKLNGYENIARENLGPADQAFLIHDLSQRYTAAGEDPNDTVLGDELGMTQAYASRLLKIMRNVKPQITKAWRNDGIPITVQDLTELADMKPADQLAAYEAKLHAANDEESGNGPTRGPSAWIETAMKAAERFGSFLALGEDANLFTLADLTWDSTLIEFLAENGFVKIGKKGATPKALEKIAKAAHKGYNEAIGKREEKQAKQADKAAKQAVVEAAQ